MESGHFSLLSMLAIISGLFMAYNGWRSLWSLWCLSRSMEERCVKSSFLIAAIRFTCIAVMQAFRLIRAFSRDNRGPTTPRWSVVNISFFYFCIARSQRKSGLKEPCALYLPMLIFSNQAVDIEETCILILYLRMMNTNMHVWPPSIASTGVISSNRFPRYHMQRLEMPDSMAPKPMS